MRWDATKFCHDSFGPSKQIDEAAIAAELHMAMTPSEILSNSFSGFVTSYYENSDCRQYFHNTAMKYQG